MSIGERIRQRRQALDWSQGELAQRAGMRQNVISRLEAGGIKNPGADVIRRLAKSLYVTTDWLLGMHEEGPADPPLALAATGTG